MFRINKVAILVGIVIAAIALPTAANAVPPGPSSTSLLSAVPSGEAGDGASRDVSITADGAFAAFSSTSSNLDGATGGIPQIFVREIATGRTTMISKAGGAPGNGASWHPVFSADGSNVAYLSRSTNLVGLTGSGRSQALLWYRPTSSTTLASVNDAAFPAAAGRDVVDLAISGDGQTVAFSTDSTNLSILDTHGKTQVYERGLFSGTSLMSVNPARTEGSATGASQPALSYHGDMLAMVSTVPTGTPGNDHAQILVVDRATHAVSIASSSATGTELGDGDSASPSLSASGEVVAYASSAGNLTNDHLGSGIYVTTIRSRSTVLASPSVTTGRNAAGTFAEPALSGSGSTVAFSAVSHDLIRNSPVTNDEAQVYVRDLSRSITSLASTPSVAVEGADSRASAPSLSSSGDLVAFTSTATNLVPGTAAREQVYLRNLQQVPSVERVGGADRFGVSASVSASTFGTGVPAVLIASGATYPDALSGSAAAGARHAPVLLVTKDGIPAAASAELTRLKPKQIIMLGGTDTIGTSVEHDLAAFSPAVSRIGGPDRFAVSAAVSAAVFGLSGAPTPVAYIASGAVFPDALSGSAAAGYAGAPVLLVRQDAVPAPVSAELARLRPGRIVVLGGTNSVGDSTMTALAAIAPTTRIAGADRFEVSASTSAASFSPGTRTAYIASGAVFPDALSGSAAAIRRSGPVLLVTSGAIPAPVKAELLRLKPTRIIILGGPATVSDAVQTELASYAVAPG